MNHLLIGIAYALYSFLTYVFFYYHKEKLPRSLERDFNHGAWFFTWMFLGPITSSVCLVGMLISYSEKLENSFALHDYLDELKARKKRTDK